MTRATRSPWGEPWSVQLAQALSVHQGVLGWLEQAGLPGGAHGADLVEALAHVTPQPPEHGEILLVWWHHVGLVRPGRVSCPTTSQRTLGSGGRLLGYGGPGRPPGEHPATWYRWARVGPIWLRGSGG